MSESELDLFVIGAGSGGVRAARMAASTGAKVAVAEERYLGGTCVNVGCVPKKLFVHASHYAEDFPESQGFGWSAVDSRLDWPTLRDNKNNEIKRLNGIYEKLLNDADVEIISGHARIESAREVSVAGKHYACKRILLATGTWPFIPEFTGREHAISSNEVFYLDKLPSKPVVVGGGYIGVEFAGIFNGLGCDTRLVYRGEKLLRHFDTEIGDIVTEEIRKKGVGIELEAEITRIEKRGEHQFDVYLDNGEVLDSDCILYATGRKPLLDNLGMENVAVELDAKGKVKVDAGFETTEAGVFALGDIIDSPELTPVAIAEAMVFMRRAFHGEQVTLDYANIPTAIFSQPNIGTVGLSEAEATEAGYEFNVFKSKFRALKHTLSGSDEQTFMKLLVDTATDRVLGVHMVGAEAGEIIQGMGVALKAGATKAEFDSTIGIHPTSAEEFVTMREPA